MIKLDWIPASAGMTEEELGMTEEIPSAISSGESGFTKIHALLPTSRRTGISEQTTGNSKSNASKIGIPKPSSLET